MIERVQVGSSPTLLDASKANQLIDKVNALSNMNIIRGGNDAFYVSDSNSVLSLSNHSQAVETAGGSIDATELDVWICINGVAVERTFLLKPEPEPEEEDV